MRFGSLGRRINSDRQRSNDVYCRVGHDAASHPTVPLSWASVQTYSTLHTYSYLHTQAQSIVAVPSRRHLMLLYIGVQARLEGRRPHRRGPVAWTTPSYADLENAARGRREQKTVHLLHSRLRARRQRRGRKHRQSGTADCQVLCRGNPSVCENSFVKAAVSVPVSPQSARKHVFRAFQ